MKLPADITESEMKIILKEIRIDYAPEQSYDFIDQLSLENLKLLFDFISTKDPLEQDKKRKILEDKIHYSRLSVNVILQKIQLVKIQVDEKNDQDDDISIEKLENQF
jgi:hypothetical protein